MRRGPEEGPSTKVQTAVGVRVVVMLILVSLFTVSLSLGDQKGRWREVRFDTIEIGPLNPYSAC